MSHGATILLEAEAKMFFPLSYELSIASKQRSMDKTIDLCKLREVPSDDGDDGVERVLSREKERKEGRNGKGHGKEGKGKGGKGKGKGGKGKAEMTPEERAAFDARLKELKVTLCLPCSETELQYFRCTPHHPTSPCASALHPASCIAAHAQPAQHPTSHSHNAHTLIRTNPREPS